MPMRPCDAQVYINTGQIFIFLKVGVLFTHLDVSDIIRIPIYFFLVTAFPGMTRKGQKVGPVGGSWTQELEFQCSSFVA